MAPIALDYLFAESINSKLPKTLQLNNYPGQKTVRDLKDAIKQLLGNAVAEKELTIAFGVVTLNDCGFMMQ